MKPMFLRTSSGSTCIVDIETCVSAFQKFRMIIFNFSPLEKEEIIFVLIEFVVIQSVYF